MQPLPYKEFIKQVKNRLNNMPKADLDDMILHWAEKYYHLADQIL